MNPLFIDKDVNIFHEQKAEKLLSTTNDKCFLQNGQIIEVSINRWNEAQSYEEKTWMINGISENDDRNYEHLIRFDNYSSINFKNFTSFIELGCGPFTNTRLIIDRISINCDIYLLDPLIDIYKNHPNCTYKNNILSNKKVNTIKSSIEILEENKRYDCVLMNNVLEHCYNIDIIFDKILKIINNNGFLIFSDVCFLKSSIAELCENIYDAGHPIKISKDYIDLFLNKNFNTIYNKDIYGLYDQPWRIDKYFIGQKLNKN